ncbi:unnamed protein product [Allacma fusca]|uniref:Uncharacterized protein n=1 Tax=Allacma fusca TaxID=39272 RepID=A0A8J2P1N6_9HEXA|nr:unnamed protein product [Allacma fusca]
MNYLVVTIEPIQSMYAKDTDGKEVREIVIVSDWEGLDISQITHLPTVMFTLTLIRTYLDIASQAFGYAFAINDLKWNLPYS